MKMFPLYVALLLAAAVPAWATQPAPPTAVPASAASSEAALRQEFGQLQQRMDKLAKRMGTLSVRLGETAPHSMIYQILADPDHGRIGALIRPDQAHHGYEVMALTPDAPAEQAGIHVGDIITAVNGKPVHPDRQASNPFPLGKLKAGQTVKLSLLRDGKPLTRSVTAKRLFAWGGVTTPALHMDSLQALESALKATQNGHKTETWTFTVPCTHCANGTLTRTLEPSLSSILSPWWGLNLAPLNADLGSYFGTRHGALVLTTQPDRYPGLQAGDVIINVDGHAVQTPGDVMRGLQGSAQGDTVHMSVMRHGHKREITMKVPPPAIDALQFPGSATSTATTPQPQPATRTGKQ